MLDWKCSLKFSIVYITFAHCRLWHYADCCLSIFVLYSLNFCPLTFCSEGEAWISTFFHTCNSILFKMGRNNFRKSILISQFSIKSWKVLLHKWKYEFYTLFWSFVQGNKFVKTTFSLPIYACHLEHFLLNFFFKDFNISRT